MRKEDLLFCYEGIHSAMQKCWTAATGTESYRRKDWQELQRAVDNFANVAAAHIGYSGPLLPKPFNGN